ncbi:hypothetical protein [Kocuria carniphila]|uniref:hypothetical protein n=1 Tax=Kocuria carniphila TaxID=262208 RepID=UPI00101CFF8D|nr:hypothetical protein [Kocuria carniphila]
MNKPSIQSVANWQPPTWRSLRKPLLLILAGVVIVVLLWSTVINFFLVSRDPQSPVEAYLGQLERGSARQVLAPLSIATSDPTVQILPNSVYRNSHDRPVGHEVVSVSEHGTQADVEVDVRMGDGQTHRVTYTVDQLVSTGFLNDTWQLNDVDDVMVAVKLPAAVDALSVNGQTVRPDAAALRAADDTAARTWQFEGLPGSYNVAMPDDSYLVASKHAVGGINISDPQALALELSFGPSPRMWETVDREIGVVLGDCESGRRLDLEKCPAPSSWAKGAASGSETAQPDALPDGVTDVKWELERRPALVLQPEDNDPLTFHAQRYRPAVAKVTFREDGRTKTERVEFGLDVTTRSTGNNITTDVQLRRALTDTERAFDAS